MGYIKAILPMEAYRLFMEMESGSMVIVDLSNKLHTAKYAELADESFFKAAVTDGNYVTWNKGSLRVTVNELLEVVLLG
jgi:hypothetical protein